MSLLQSVDYVALAPVLVAGGAAIAVLLVDLVLPLPVRRAGVLGTAILGAVGALVAALALIGKHRGTFCTPAGTLATSVRVGRSCSYTVDSFTVYLLVLLSAAAAGALMLAATGSAVRSSAAGAGANGGGPTPLPLGEYGFLVLSSLTGALTLVGARDLITLLVGLETLTLPTYALVGLRRSGRVGAEAAVKYLLVSVAATAVTLLGIAFVYGLTGTLHLDRIAAVFAARDDLRSLPLASAAVMMVLFGFAFKMAAVPFHWWAPDVYQGAPVSVAAFLATVSKAGGVAGLLLVTLVAFPDFRAVWGTTLAVLAAASMTVGNLVALRQRQAVRLLAWSSVAQAGYLLVPLGALAMDSGADARTTAVQATLGYLALYVATNLGAFACVTAVGRRFPSNLLTDYRGLARQSPLLSAALAFFLFGLAGLPPTLAGLVAKVVVLRAALLDGAGWLAVVVALNTVLGLAYYLRLAAMPFRGTAPSVATAPSPATVPSPAIAPVPAGVAAAGVPAAGMPGVVGVPGAVGTLVAAGPPSGSDGVGVGGPALPPRQPAYLRTAPVLAAAILITVVVVAVLSVAPQLVLGSPGLP